MFSTPPEPKRPTLGLRLAIWYAAIFVVSSLALIGVTYFLLSTALRQYDREVIESTLVRYATAYRTAGVNGLVAAIRRDETGASYEALFVRAVAPFQNDLVYISPQTTWSRYDLAQLKTPAPGEQTWSMLGGSEQGEPLEVASVRLNDGTLFQVGKSTARREALLGRFRLILLIDFASLIAIGLAGGAVFTASALRPLTSLNDTVREILRTGNVHSRVPAREQGDALDELGLQVNAMLDRIESLIGGMRGALDNVAHDLRTPMMRLRGIAETRSPVAQRRRRHSGRRSPTASKNPSGRRDAQHTDGHLRSRDRDDAAGAGAGEPDRAGGAGGGAVRGRRGGSRRSRSTTRSLVRSGWTSTAPACAA